jgi:hypothetical protein
MEALHCPGHHDLVLHVKNAYEAEDGIFYDARGYRDLFLFVSLSICTALISRGHGCWEFSVSTYLNGIARQQHWVRIGEEVRICCSVECTSYPEWSGHQTTKGTSFAHSKSSTYLIAQEIAAPTCGTCSSALSRPLACLQCSYIGCWHDGHAIRHLKEAGHSFCELNNVFMYCLLNLYLNRHWC